MTRSAAWPVWLGFAATSAAAAAAVAAGGLQIAGRTDWVAADGSVLAGCLASLAGSWIGAVPLARALGGRLGQSGSAGLRRGNPPAIPVAAIGKASLYRLLGTLLAGGGAALFGGWQRRSLLLTVAVSYVLLLAVETGWLMTRLRASSAQNSNGTIGDAQDGA